MSRFNVNDKVRCIDDSHQPLLIFIYVNTVYVVECVDTQGFVRLFGCGGLWNEDRFELVSTAPACPSSGRSSSPWNTVYGQLSGPVQPPLRISGIAAMVAEDVGSWGSDHWDVPTTSMLKCECGVDSIGGGKHSDYCPKHD